MSTEPPAERTPDHAPIAPHGQAITEGGYSYTLADDDAQRAKVRRQRPALRIGVPVLAALIIVPAILIGVAAWFVSRAMSDDGGDARTNANVASVVNVFYQGQGGTVRTLEGKLPNGYPGDIPSYPGSRIVSSLVQVNGENAAFLVVYDTSANADDVTHYFDDKFGADPWQIEARQDTREESVRQFSKINDANITGIVLASDSNDANVTTIVESIQVASGAKDVDLGNFSPPVSKAIPAGFPDSIPPYPDGIIIETISQRASQGDQYGITLITKDSASDALDFFRKDFEGKSWTVKDADVSQSTITDAAGISFQSKDGSMTGNVVAGQFDDDKNYSRVEVQVTKLDASSSN